MLSKSLVMLSKSLVVLSKSPVMSECGICLDEINTWLYTTPCGHKYHRNCLHKWCVKNNNCPSCRRENVMNMNMNIRKSITTHVFEYFERINNRVDPPPPPPLPWPIRNFEAYTCTQLYTLRGNDAQTFWLYPVTVHHAHWRRGQTEYRRLPHHRNRRHRASLKLLYDQLQMHDDVNRIWRSDNEN
jgi:DNA-binding helix-hairpin-helix protein with protein kinase domain